MLRKDVSYWNTAATRRLLRVRHSCHTPIFQFKCGQDADYRNAVCWIKRLGLHLTLRGWLTWHCFEQPRYHTGTAFMQDKKSDGPGPPESGNSAGGSAVDTFCIYAYLSRGDRSMNHFLSQSLALFGGRNIAFGSTASPCQVSVLTWSYTAPSTISTIANGGNRPCCYVSPTVFWICLDFFV